ncbi:MAG: glycosyltransferase family 2 protein [Chloroflexi bacterium]|uniref:Glycosyltransferase family 2 protein n=1 Tax=Candidatus Chlorohelix allophototropha TaxID=3003348 RepID=A0A8T7LYX3_9CHLR|nr:glycosyltransferase family 2 protein [Chloroflexota bacterium]WJW66577.1 glycosyltransferase family 2 protein [Chloroflexota bacterium L227-S17]
MPESELSATQRVAATDLAPKNETGKFVTDLDIIIVNYKTPVLLRDCLNSIFASHCNFDYRVYVVDNGSQDDSAEMVRREFENKYPNLHLIASQENGGFAFGNNLALRQVCPLFAGATLDSYNPGSGCCPQAHYVLLLNPDTVLPPDALQIMYDFMQSNPLAGAVGPKLVRANGKLDLACRRSFPTPEISFWRMTGLSKLFPKNRLFARYNLTYLDPDKLYEVDSVCGAFMLVRAEALAQVGYLDEKFFMYGEDLDWALRIKKKGWKIFYNPAATVLHLKGESSKQRPAGAIINFYHAMDVFYRKHYANQTFFLLNWLIYGGIWGKAGLTLAINYFRPKKQRRVS